MSEFELAELAGTAMSNFLTSFTVFISIVTAYVVAAFAAGQKLTELQASVVTMCFLIASASIGLLSVLIFRVFLLRTWAVAVLYVILVCGSLVFMRNVRQQTATE